MAEISHAGRGAAPSTDTYIVVDAFVVRGIRLVDDAGLTFFASANSPFGWSTTPDSRCISGTQHYTHGPGDVCRFVFEGDFLEVVYYVAPNMGLLDIVVNTQMGLIDCHSTVARFQQTARFQNLGGGKHVARIMHGGRGSSSSADTYIAIDAFRVQDL